MTKYIVQTKLHSGSIVNFKVESDYWLSMTLSANDMVNFKTLAIFHVK